jgi:hypothetical protein
MKICQPVRFLVAAATLAFPTIGRATLLVYEPFDYPAGQLTGANGGVGFASSWGGFRGEFSIQTGNLQTNGFVSPGNEAHYLATTYQNIGRQLSGVYDGASGTDLWASYLTNVASSGAFTSLAIGQLQPGNLHIGILGNGSGPPLNNWGMDTFGGAGQVFSNVPVVYGQTVLLVVHIQFLTGPDHIDLFVNPTPGAPPSTPNATKTDLDLGQTLQTQGGYIYLAAYIGNVLYDDIRIGTTYGDVVPVPEPSAVGLTLMALAGVAVLWTRSNHPGLSDVPWRRKLSLKPALVRPRAEHPAVGRSRRIDDELCCRSTSRGGKSGPDRLPSDSVWLDYAFKATSDQFRILRSCGTVWHAQGPAAWRPRGRCRSCV